MAVSDDATAPDATEDVPARDQLLIALEHLLQEHTLDELKVAQILERANISRATFYFYFASRDDAFVALLTDVVDQIVPRLDGAFATRDTDNLDGLRQLITNYLRLGGTRARVIRSASEEWPRSPEVRESYLAGVRRQAEVLTKVIEADRKAGVAPDGIPAPQLASGLLWTMERVWYRAVTGAPDLNDFDAATAAVADVVVSAIYGR